MILNAVLITDSHEISTEVVNATRVRMSTISKVSRITETSTFVLTDRGWLCLRGGSYASMLQSHLLDYSLSRWVEDGGEAKQQFKRDVAAINAHPHESEVVRQTNSFQGKNWK